MKRVLKDACEDVSPAAYRVLIIAPDGSVLRTRRLLARDDAEAIQCTDALRCEKWTLELWKGNILIGELAPLADVEAREGIKQ